MDAHYLIVIGAEFDAKFVEAGLNRLNLAAKSLETNGKKAMGALSGGAFAIRGIATEAENALRGLMMALTAVTLAGGALARQAINMSAEFEVLKITFENLTGSVTVADKLIRDMKDFAVRTPLQLRDIEAAGTMLLAFGENAENVIPTLNRLGQAAVALNKPLEQFIRARNLLQQGIVLSRTLAPLGISRDTLAQFGAGAGASGDELVAAFDKSLQRFDGLFEKTFNTIRGRISNLKDSLDVMFASIGDPMRDTIIRVVDDITRFFGEVRRFFEENKLVIERAFASIAAAAETFIAPVTNIFRKFLLNLKEHPEEIQKLANGFVTLTKAIIGIVVVGNVVVGLLKLWAAVTLLHIAWPRLIGVLQLFRTTIVTGFIPALGSAIVKLGIFADSMGLTMIYSKSLLPFLAGMSIALATLAAPIVILVIALRKMNGEFEVLQDNVNAATSAFDNEIKGLDSIAQFTDRVNTAIANHTTNESELMTVIETLTTRYPNLLNQTGMAIDANNVLHDAAGNAVTGIDALQGVINGFSTSIIVDECGRASEALLLLSQQRLLEAAGPEPTTSADWLEWATGDFEGFSKWGSDLSNLVLGQIGTLWRSAGEATLGTTTSNIAGATAQNLADAQVILDRLNALRNRAASGGGGGSDLNPPGGGGGGTAPSLEELGLKLPAMLEALKLQGREEQKLTDIRERELRVISDMLKKYDELAAAEEARSAMLDKLNHRADYNAVLRQATGNALPKSMGFDPNEQLKLRGFETFSEYIESLPDDMDDVFRNFIVSLSDTLTSAIAKMGWSGGKMDLMGMAQGLLKPITDEWGKDLASKWGLGEDFGGPIGGLLLGGIGWLANSIFGKEEALQIAGPVDVNIVDISTNALNLFSFKGFGGFTFTSRYRGVFQSGIY